MSEISRVAGDVQVSTAYVLRTVSSANDLPLALVELKADVICFIIISRKLAESVVLSASLVVGMETDQLQLRQSTNGISFTMKRKLSTYLFLY